MPQETHDVGKVVPKSQVLDVAWRRVMARQQVASVVREAEAKARQIAAKLGVPPDLVDQVRALIVGTARSWDEAVEEIVSRSRSDGSAS